MNETVIQAAALIVPLVFAIVFHEVAHGMMARALGDPTADEQGRLSLNPLRHVDPIGTVVLPGILALTHLPVFGWAKPVPVNAARLNHPRRDMILVGAAGPGSNLIMAAIAAVVLGLVLRPYGGSQEPAGVIGFIVLNLFNFISINVFLALFNLLPIPPFDGSHIVEGLLPPRAAAVYDRLRPFGFPLVFILLVGLPYLIPGFDLVSRIVLPPVQRLGNHYYALAEAVAGR